MGGKEARDAQYLGYADGLLFHRFVNCNLVFNVHLVKLIDAAHTVGGSAKCGATGIAVPTKTPQNIYKQKECKPVVRKHECSCFNAKFASFTVFHDAGSETGRG